MTNIYSKFYGLLRDPFSMLPEPEFLFLTQVHQEALATLTYALAVRKYLVVLTGEVGTGKTILLNQLVRSLSHQNAIFSHLAYPRLSANEFLEMVLLGFGAENVPSSKPKRLALFNRMLESAVEAGRQMVVIVDEAHLLTPKTLEEVRLLTNPEWRGGKPLQIVLAGQSELSQLLNRVELRQLKQRIEARVGLRPLEGEEICAYMTHRWKVAGASQDFPFTADAVQEIERASGGVPRLVNVLCDNSLVTAFAENSLQVTPRHVEEAAADLDLSEPNQTATHSHAKVAPNGSLDHHAGKLGLKTMSESHESALGVSGSRAV